MSELLTATQLAERLQINPDTVRLLTRTGRIPHHKIGGAIRYDLAEVLAATAAPAQGGAAV